MPSRRTCSSSSKQAFFRAEALLEVSDFIGPFRGRLHCCRGCLVQLHLDGGCSPFALPLRVLQGLAQLYLPVHMCMVELPFDNFVFVLDRLGEFLVAQPPELVRQRTQPVLLLLQFLAGA